MKTIVGYLLILFTSVALALGVIAVVNVVNPPVVIAQGDTPLSFYDLLSYADREFPNHLLYVDVVGGQNVQRYIGTMRRVTPGYLCVASAPNEYNDGSETCVRLASVDAVVFLPPIHP